MRKTILFALALQASRGIVVAEDSTSVKEGKQFQLPQRAHNSRSSTKKPRESGVKWHRYVHIVCRVAKLIESICPCPKLSDLLVATIQANMLQLHDQQITGESTGLTRTRSVDNFRNLSSYPMCITLIEISRCL